MDNIFSHFIARGDTTEAHRRLSYASWFIDAVPLLEFEGDEKLFCEYLDYSVQLGAPITYKYLQVWLDTELREVMRKLNVHVPGTEQLRFEDPSTFETAYQTTVKVLSDDFKVLETMDSDVDDFKVEVAAFFTNKRSSRLTAALAETFDKLNDTDSSDAAADFALDSINAIKEIYSSDKLDELNESEILDRVQMEKVAECGLPAIDKDSGGLFTTQLFDIEAQPGTGKTRFAVGAYAYDAVVNKGKNVVFYTLEQTSNEIKYMMIARHVFEMFNIQMSDKMILTGNIPESIRPQYEAAKFDLFESGKYGKFVVREEDMYVETFITKLRTHDKLYGPFDLIIIDYMGLIESKPAQYRREMAEYEIIKTAFRQFKRYLRKTKKAGISISQFNREGIQAGKNDKEITTDMAQGGIAVFRNTDYNIAISMTDSMKLQQKRRFSQPKVRSSSGFNSFIVDTRLAFCYFMQAKRETV